MNRARALWEALRPASLRHRLILSVAAVHLVLMTLFIVDLTLRQRAFLSHHSQEHAEALVRTLAVNAASWVLADDVAGLQEIVGSAARYPEVRYAMVSDPDGKVLAHTDPSRVGLTADDPVSRSLRTGPAETRVLASGPSGLDVASPVTSKTGDLLGWARVGQGRGGISANLAQVRRSGLLYTFLALVVGSAFAFVIGRRLAAGLERLLEVSARIRDGRRDLRVPAEGDDEVARLGAGLNEMLEALLASEKRTARALEFSENLIQTANVIFVQLDAEGRVVRINEETEKTTGWTQAELAGKDWFKTVLPPAEYERVWTEFRRLMTEGEVARTFENLVRTRSGEERRVLWQNSILKEDGVPVGTISFAVDVTERARAAAQLAQMEAQLRQAQKLESVGRLAGGVAHDFNNILMAILGYSESLRRDLPLGDPRQKDLQEIVLAAERAAALTRQLLAFSRRQPLQKAVVDLNAVVRGLQPMLRRLVGEDVEMVERLLPAPAAVLADRHLLEQVVLNLVVNARDAMPRGGKLTLGVSTTDLDEAFARAHPPARAGRHVTLEVADTGVGMDAETLGRLFEPFFTTKGVGKGTGLGLSTVYGIVQQCEGAIEVTSAPGRGSAFRVHLPVTEAALPATPAPAARGAGERRRARVLLVEDEETVRRIVSRLLRAEGHEVVECRNGSEALRLIEQDPGAFDLMITDLVMPGMNGVELAGRVRARRPGVRILYISGYTEGRVLGAADDFLQKPFSMEALAKKVQDLLAAKAASAARPGAGA